LALPAVTKEIQIAEAMECAKQIKLNKDDGVLSHRLIRESRVVPVIVDATFEIRYMMACSQLGFTDLDVCNHVKDKLLKGSKACR